MKPMNRTGLLNRTACAYSVCLWQELPEGFPPAPVVATQEGFEGLYAGLPNAKCATAYEPKRRGISVRDGSIHVCRYIYVYIYVY